jgi:hypothetical protein
MQGYFRRLKRVHAHGDCFLWRGRRIESLDLAGKRHRIQEQAVDGAIAEAGDGAASEASSWKLGVRRKQDPGAKRREHGARRWELSAWMLVAPA